MKKADVEASFPELVGSAWDLTSPPTTKYNCIGWAAGDAQMWWWPEGPNYWPPGVPRQVELQAFIDAYATLGYVQCPSGELEGGAEKIVIYLKDGLPTHAARQLENGAWTSKLGRQVDISHPFEGLNGNQYGVATCFMRRPRLARD